MIKNGEVHTNSSSFTPSSPTSATASSSETELSPEKGDILVLRQMLGTVHKEIPETQRENIFHS